MAYKPWNINEIIAAFGGETGGDTTLNEVKEAMLAGLEFDCPQCGTTGRILNPENPTEQIDCPTCDGMGKTEVEYEAYAIETGYRVKEEDTP
jgi:hypothetical protein